MRTTSFLTVAAAAALIAAPTAFGQGEEPGPSGLPEAEAQRGVTEPLPEPKPATVSLKVGGINGGKLDVGHRARAVGIVRPFVPGQTVRVQLTRRGNAVDGRVARIRQIGAENRGKFRLVSAPLVKSGPYRVRAKKLPTEGQDGFEVHSDRFGIRYPNLGAGQSSNAVELFNELLAAKAYVTAQGRHYGSATGRAVLAFRKVNGMARTTDATTRIFKTLADGKGGFNLKWPEGGKHVEADLSRQVMVLARYGKPQHIFHISSGAPATPTITGKLATFRKDYGTNSLGMIHSVYFGPTNRGYATHGYKSVPTYPASHGCLRNPPPNSKFIYNWIDIGDIFYVYP
ncbi:MAG: L,D-transpeptidase [Actinomycetota bacterium]|nr:L,D-transpeptidase [Actinomycetota bacterium]